MRLVFWHPFLSIHHAPVLRRLSSMPGIKVQLVTRTALEAGRDSGGWSVPDYGDTEVFDTSRGDWRELAQSVVNSSAGDETLHLISDALSHPISRYAWKYCRDRGVPFGFICIRPGMYVGPFGRVWRKVFYRQYVRRAAAAANPILTVAADCREYFLKSGFAGERIFPWAYFVDPPDYHSPLTTHHSPLRLICLGRLIKRKRIDLLLRAIAALRPQRDVSLAIVGGGPEEDALKRMACEMRLDGHVTFKPSVPHERVPGELQKYDALVLPTELDDWGVVVNEALQAGLAVITTQNAGASELIEHSHAGLVCGCDAEAMKRAIATLHDSPQALFAMRKHAQEYAKTISPQSAAQYLLAIARHVLHAEPRPDTPWFTTTPQETIANDRTQDRFCYRGGSLAGAHRLLRADATAHLHPRT
ncbi:MAG TPA: glycosyltransferase [Planctomycetota bacterium]|jgi:glycosyltransferase involved in cell wall biosynthesis